MIVMEYNNDSMKLFGGPILTVKLNRIRFAPLDIQRVGNKLKR